MDKQTTQIILLVIALALIAWIIKKHRENNAAILIDPSGRLHAAAIPGLNYYNNHYNDYSPEWWAWHANPQMQQQWPQAQGHLLPFPHNIITR